MAGAAVGGGLAAHAAAAAAAEGDDTVPLEKRACTICPPGVPCALFSLAPPRRAPRVRQQVKAKASDMGSVMASQSQSPSGSFRQGNPPIPSTGSISLGNPRVPRRQNSRLFAGLNVDPTGKRFMLLAAESFAWSRRGIFI